MKPIQLISALLLGAVLGGAGVWLARTRHEAEKEKSENAEHKAAPHAEGGEAEHGLKLDKAKLTALGLETAKPEPLQHQPEAKGYGRVLDPTPLITLLAEIDTAEAALAASTKELDRTKTLFAQNQNVSARAQEMAEVQMRRDALQLESARARLLTGWGKALAERRDLRPTAQKLAALEEALVRIDLPPNDTLPSAPPRARVSLITGDNSSIDAEVIGPAPSADPQAQGQGFLLLAATRSLLPAAAVVGYLPAPGAPQSGVVLPRSAIVRHQGETFIYVRTGEETFERREVVLSRALTNGWFVTGGAEAADQVVVKGAQQLLSEELKAQGGEE